MPARGVAQSEQAAVLLEAGADDAAVLGPPLRGALEERALGVVEPGAVEAAVAFSGASGPWEPAALTALATSLGVGMILYVEVRVAPDPASRVMAVGLHRGGVRSTRFGTAAAAEFVSATVALARELLDETFGAPRAAAPPPAGAPLAVLAPPAADPLARPADPRLASSARVARGPDVVGARASGTDERATAAPSRASDRDRDEPRDPAPAGPPPSPLLIAGIAALAAGAVAWLATPLYAYGVCAYRPNCGEIAGTGLVPIAGGPLAIQQHWWSEGEEAGFWTMGLFQVALFGAGVGLVVAGLGEAPRESEGGGTVRATLNGVEIRW